MCDDSLASYSSDIRGMQDNYCLLVKLSSHNLGVFMLIWSYTSIVLY